MARFLSHLRQNRASLFFLLIAFFALLACALRTLALFFSFDADIGYFRPPSTLAILADVSLLICIAPSVAVSFLINKEVASREETALTAPRFAAAAAAALTLSIAALFALLRLEQIPAPKPVVLLAAICLLVTAVYFLCRLCAVHPRAAAPLGFFAIFGAALMLAITYLDRYTQMNAPHKISLHLCMLAIMLAMLYEQRTNLERHSPRACIAVTALAAAVCTAYALSNALAFLVGVYSNVMYFLFDLVALGFAAYFITKSIRFALIHAAENTEVEQ